MKFSVLETGISGPFDSIENPGCLVVILVKVIVDDLLIWFQNAYASFRLMVMRKRFVLNMLRDL
ncbi:MAG: hypothetical protein WA133_08350 [Syntrophales bacterium]